MSYSSNLELQLQRKAKKRKLNPEETTAKVYKILRQNESDAEPTSSPNLPPSTPSGSSGSCDIIQSYRKLPETIPVTQLQTKICLEYNQGVGKCLDCLSYKPDLHTQEPLCRFKGFRKLSFITADDVLVEGFPHPSTESTQNDVCLWLPSYEHFSVRMDLSSSKHVLSYLLPSFNTLLREENLYLEAVLKEHPGYISTWKRRVTDVRENCDICWTSLFNLHWTCKNCGFVACMDCYTSRTGKYSESLWEPKRETQHRWRECHEGQPHSPDKFTLTQVIPNDCKEILQELAHSISHQYEIPQTCSCSVQSLVDQLNSDLNVTPECQRSRIPGDKAHNEYACLDTCGPGCKIPNELPAGRLLILEDSLNEMSMPLFQRKWVQGEPVVVRNVHHELNAALWTPDSFANDYGDEPCEVVNCNDGTIVTVEKLKVFWDGFENVKKRPVATNGSYMLLKIKDWPTTETFARKCPERFMDFIKAVPMPTYTTPTGQLNLAAALPHMFVPPDLGPKLYIAYGVGPNVDKATTNLHVDISDATNVMLHVAVPTDRNSPADVELLQKLIQSCGADELSVNDALQNLDKVGAIWHIYRREEAGIIRNFLSKVGGKKKTKGEMREGDDYIHDQGTYLNCNLRARLKKDHDIIGFTIIQSLGDAIFIPAGAPHQVRNVNSSIKAALDFVSPEHVEHCLQLTNEFRYLSEGHSNHEDILQIRSIIYHSVKEAVTALKSFSPSDTDNSLDCSNVSIDGINRDSDVSSLQSELSAIASSQHNEDSLTSCANDSCISVYPSEVPSTRKEQDMNVEERNSSPDPDTALNLERHYNSTESGSKVGTIMDCSSENVINDKAMHPSCTITIPAFEMPEDTEAVPKPPMLDSDKDKELKNKAKRREYDKIKTKQRKEKKLEGKPIQEEDTELQIWLQTLISQNKELTLNPDIRLDPPERMYDLQKIQRYTEEALQQWINSQGWNLDISKPLSWKKRPEIAFKYKGNYYLICQFCHQQPELGIPGNQKQSQKWSQHRLKHQQLPCYDNSCNQRFNHPSRRRRHMKDTHCKPPWSRTIPVVPD